MRRWMTRLCALMCVVASCAVPAFAAPRQASVSDVAAALNVTRLPTNYVVLIDTSGSMKEGGLYPRVLSAVTSLLTAVAKDDQVSLVTFDSTAVVRYQGAVGTNPSSLIGNLPDVPTGAKTDIGAGIAAGLGQLERPGSPTIGAIVLITDGKLDVPDGSPYATPGNAAWLALRTRAETLTSSRQVAAYAIALTSTADAALIKDVFPKAVDLPADSIQTQLSQLQNSVSNFRLAELLRPDLKRGIEVSWQGNVSGLAPNAGTTTVSVTLRSTFARIPVEVSDLAAVIPGGPTVSLSGLPSSVTLAPGQSVTYPCTLSYQPGSGTLRLTGTIASPWQTVLKDTLNLTFEPSIDGGTTFEATVTPTYVAQTLPWVPIGLGALALAVVGLLVLIVRMAGRLPIIGSLLVLQDGQAVREYLLKGRTFSFKDASVDGPLQGLKGKVRSGKRRDATTKETHAGIEVIARRGKDVFKGVLLDGESGPLGDLQIRYTSAGARVRSLINA